MSEPPPPPPPPQWGSYPGSYPPPPPQPYAGYSPPVVPRNGLGISALVVAIIGLVFCWTVVGGVILGVTAIILGFVARGRVKRGEATNGGVAIAGIVLGCLAIVVSLVFIPIYIGMFQEVGFGNYIDCMQSAGNDRTAQQKCEDTFVNHMETQFSVTLTPTP